VTRALPSSTPTDGSRYKPPLDDLRLHPPGTASLHLEVDRRASDICSGGVYARQRSFASSQWPYLILHPSHGEEGFPPRSRACVQNGLPWLRVQQRDHQSCRLVLHLTTQPGWRWKGHQQICWLPKGMVLGSESEPLCWHERERGREIYFKSHISWWEHSSHFRLIERGVPSVSVVSQLVYKFLCLASPKENPQVPIGGGVLHDWLSEIFASLK